MANMPLSGYECVYMRVLWGCSARLATPLRSEIAVAGQRALQQQEDRQISSKAMPKLGTPLRKDIQAGNFQLLPVPMPEEQQQQQEEEQEAEMEQGQVHEIDEIFSEVAEQQVLPSPLLSARPAGG